MGCNAAGTEDANKDLEEAKFTDDLCLLECNQKMKLSHIRRLTSLCTVLDKIGMKFKET